ncbi:MAG: conserved rane-associated protein [Clostridia bacterium]|nr:conserved rane-associated protein [Clostridia bacterium]
MLQQLSSDKIMTEALSIIEVVNNMKLLIVKRTFVLFLGIIILTLFLMSVDFTFGPIVSTFRNSMEYQKAERQVLKKYSALQGKFEFSLPADWTTMEEPFSGGEIIYNIFFVSEDKKIHGFVQVWDINKPLKQFIEESKQAAVGVIDFKYYRVKELTVNTNNGYLLDYSRKSNQDNYIKSYEAFIQGSNGRIYRVSFFVEEQNWKQQYLILFNRIIRSFVIKN